MVARSLGRKRRLGVYVYTGIGSRQTPPEIIKLMEAFAEYSAKDVVLRSGGAKGADQAFEFGATLGGGRIETFLPWAGFEGIQDAVLTAPDQDAMEVGEKYHPGWKYLKQGAKKLIARDSYQILGRNLDHPTELVVCWTPDGSLDGHGSKSGGTGQALRIASDYEIPVLNLARGDHRKDVEQIIKNDS